MRDLLDLCRTYPVFVALWDTRRTGGKCSPRPSFLYVPLLQASLRWHNATQPTDNPPYHCVWSGTSESASFVLQRKTARITQLHLLVLLLKIYNSCHIIFALSYFCTTIYCILSPLRFVKSQLNPVIQLNIHGINWQGQVFTPVSWNSQKKKIDYLTSVNRIFLDE